MSANMKYEMSYIINHDMDSIHSVEENDSNETITTLESVYIPRIYGSIEPGLIAYTFENMNLGIVRNIETCKRPDSADTYMAFVYFTSWNTSNPAACNLAKRIHDPNVQARIVYDDPWYWILLPNKSEKAKNTSSSSVSTTVKKTVNVDNSVSTDGLMKKDEEIEILKLMVEDLQTRLLESEKKQIKMQKELVDVRSILLTGETLEQTIKTKEQLSFVENKKNEPLVAAKKTLVEQYVPYYYDDIESPPSPPKLVRQIATAGPIKPDEKFFPESDEEEKRKQQKSIRIDEMGLVYPERDYGFWCDP